MLCWHLQHLLCIAGYLTPHKVPSNYSWEFSGGFAHVLMNNYCQLPGGVHQFFFLSSLAPFTGICCRDFCCLPRSVILPCQWFRQQMSSPNGHWRHGALPWLLGLDLSMPGCVLPCPYFRKAGYLSSFLHDALPYMDLQGPWLKLLVKNKNKSFSF